MALSDDMVFRLTFNGAATDFSSPHVKVKLFNGDGGRKVGSLLSQHIPLQPVPEPQSYAMLLGGLGLMGLAARRRKALSRYAG